MYYFKRMRSIQALFLTLILSFSCIFFTVKQLIPVYASEETTEDEEEEITLDEVLVNSDCLDDVEGFFDSYNHSFEDGILTITAIKNFSLDDLSGFEPLQYNSDGTVDITYEISYDRNKHAIRIDEYIENGETDIEVVDTILGLIVERSENEIRDIMLIVKDEDYWLSEVQALPGYEDSTVSTYAWGVVNDFFEFCGKLTKDLTEVALEPLAKIVKPALDVLTTVFHSVAKAEGTEWCANFLNMEFNEGFSSAQVNCWQQFFGYNDTYDLAFNAGTSMRYAKIPFDVDLNGIDDHIIWIWKGDYLTLGAGAELGIYQRFAWGPILTNHWIVNKRLSMEMTLLVEYNDISFIDYTPDKKQWWITGFRTYDSDDNTYMNIDRDDLTARFTVDFSTLDRSKIFYFGNFDFYEAFKIGCGSIDTEVDYSFDFDDRNQIWSFEF